VLVIIRFIRLFKNQFLSIFAKNTKNNFQLDIFITIFLT
jgi:hypothetical protein